MVQITTSEQPDGVAQLERAARLAEQAGDLDRALGYFRGVGQIDPQNPIWAFEAVRVLRRAGRSTEAVSALRDAMRKWPTAQTRPDIQSLVPEIVPQEGQLQQALGEDCPPDEALKRPLIEDDGASDVIVARGGRKAVVLVFTGLADRMVLPLPVFDRYLAELDLSAIFLRDRRRVGFLSGIASLGDDYESSLEGLRAKIAELGAETVYTVGNSAGGIGALSHGLDLGAAKVLAFSSPLVLTRAVGDVDRRAPVFLDRILKISAERLDFATRLEKAGGATEVNFFYGEEMPEDRYHAEYVRGRPGVIMRPLPGLAGHGALFQMAQKNGLRPLFREAFGGSDA